MVTSRLEACDPEWTRRFDVVTARAVAPVDEVIAVVLPLLGPDAMLLLWHSDRQRRTVEAMTDRRISSTTYTLDNTLSYHMTAIDFLSNISCIRRER